MKKAIITLKLISYNKNFWNQFNVSNSLISKYSTATIKKFFLLINKRRVRYY